MNIQSERQTNKSMAARINSRLFKNETINLVLTPPHQTSREKASNWKEKRRKKSWAMGVVRYKLNTYPMEAARKRTAQPGRIGKVASSLRPQNHQPPHARRRETHVLIESGNRWLNPFASDSTQKPLSSSRVLPHVTIFRGGAKAIFALCSVNINVY